MSEWVAVVQEEGDEPIEIPTESDGTILLTSLTAQFPGSTGLKFRNPETNTLRGVRCSENQLFPPHEDGWSSHTYICTRPKIPVVQSQTTKLKDEAVLKVILIFLCKILAFKFCIVLVAEWDRRVPKTRVSGTCSTTVEK